MKSIPALTLLLTASAAIAANWVSLGRSTSGKHEQETFIDSSSIRDIGNIRRAWVKHVVPPHSEKGTQSRKWLQYEMISTEFNCMTETNRPVAIYEFYEDNSSSQMQGQLGSFEPAIPGSALDDETHYVCNWKPE